MGQPELAEVIDLRDPERLGRLRLRYQWPVAQAQEAETDWVRATTPYSGDGKGQLFSPELGSQVLVGYEQHRAEQPVVLGNLVHGNNAQKAKYSPAANGLKGIQTAGGNKIVFHDHRGGEKITISNGKNSKYKNTALEISFSDKGTIVLRTTGSILLSAGDMIQLSAREIRLEADENIDLNGLQKVNVNTDDFKVDAYKSVTVQANDTVKVDGKTKIEVIGMSVEMKAELTADIKGKIVNINS